MAPPITDGLVLDLDPALGITKDGSNRVSQWNDQSGQGNHFVQATEANMPVWNAQLSGHEMPYLQFSGNQWMDCVKKDMFRNVPGATVIIVMRTDVGALNQTYFYCSDGDQSDHERISLYAVTGSNGSSSLRAKRLDSDTYVYSMGTGTAFNDSTGWVLSGRVNFVSPQMSHQISRWFTPSVSDNPTGSGNTSDTDSVDIIIGKSYGTNNYTSGKIIRILAFDRFIGSSELEEIHDYFDAQYFSVNKTFGVGADFTDLGSALGWLAARSAEWGGIYASAVITGISDSNQDSATSVYNIYIAKNAEIDVEINGGNFTIAQDSCGFDVSLNPVSWWTNPYFGSYNTQNYNYNSAFKFHSFKINAFGTSVYPAVRLRPRGLGTEYYNILIFSNDYPSSRIGLILYPYRRSEYYLRAYNIIIVGLSTGIGASTDSGANAGTGGYDNQIIENCTLLNCGYGTLTDYIGAALFTRNPQSLNLVIRNVAILRNDGISGRDIIWNSALITLQNCATSDESTFADRALTQPAQIDSCLDSISTDELASLDPAASNYLRPLALVVHGLWDSGIVPEYATVDYTGIPFGADGYYPIGALKNYLVITGETPDDEEIPGGGFGYDLQTGLFTANADNSIICTIKLILGAKARSLKAVDGIPVYPGDWFFDPRFGTNCYEIKTMATDVLKRVEDSIKIAIKYMFRDLPVQVRATRDPEQPNRINTTIEVVDKNETITYTQFIEVV